MLKQLSAKDFLAVPYLETSQLMQAHNGTIKFSANKPTVIIGPNGAGKSALLTAIALRHLAFLTGTSAFDDHYVQGRECDEWWGREHQWSNDWQYLPGMQCKGDLAPMVYYRPGHLPGNECNVATAMMCGYFDEAKAYARQVEKKSSGQANQALLERLCSALKGEQLPQGYACQNWRFAEARWDEKRLWQPRDYRAEVLKRQMQPPEGAIPLVAMDEPEQSLDALAEAQLWRAIESADAAKCQVIVATHSAYPLLNPGKFHIVEATPGYAKQVADLYRF